MLLEIAWQNTHVVVPLYTTNALKPYGKGRRSRVPATRNPFSSDEAHLVEAAFYDDVSKESDTSCSKATQLERGGTSERCDFLKVKGKKEKGESSGKGATEVVDLEKG